MPCQMKRDLSPFFICRIGVKIKGLSRYGAAPAALPSPHHKLMLFLASSGTLDPYFSSVWRGGGGKPVPKTETSFLISILEKHFILKKKKNTVKGPCMLTCWVLFFPLGWGTLASCFSLIGTVGRLFSLSISSVLLNRSLTFYILTSFMASVS